MAPARSSAEPRRWRAVIGAVAAALALAGGESGAQQKPAPKAAVSGWQLCNQTSYILEAATGRPDDRTVVVQGWIRLRPGQCAIAAPGPLVRGVHYVYARTSPAHRGGRRQWGGDARLCIDPTASFAVQNPPSCEQMGLEERTFRRVQINKRDSWRTSFAEASPYTLYGARSQGFQRLLEDAGYDARTASGRSDPRRAADAIQRFRAEAKLPATATEDQVIDALENAARRRAAAIGLTLCNRTSGRIWSAVARRRGEGWESRGWWPLGPGGCARAVDDPLLQTVYFVHAALESPQGERYLAAAGETFCTSPTKFAIIGRERCADRYYDETLFTAISSDGREGLVVEFAEGDFLPAGARPQRSVTPRATADAPIPGTGFARGRAPASAGAAAAGDDAGQVIPPRAPRPPGVATKTNDRTTLTLPGARVGAGAPAPKAGVQVPGPPPAASQEPPR
ncbi:MAG: DUF1036 domain-containing protein [Hyphomonadaceae bacterium]|nr:DUF1036 domain-containing protein [Hyphomonadaceae bacterium]